MSATRIGATSPGASGGAGTSAGTDRQTRAPAAVEPMADLGAAMADLAQWLVKDTETSRLATAQSQVEALMYAAKLAVARGDAQALRGLSSEAGRISRDLSSSGLAADQVAAVVAQAGQVNQLCDGGGHDGDDGERNPASAATDIVT